MDFVNRTLQQIRTFWSQLSRKQQITLVAAVGLVLTGLLSLVFWANRVVYKPLFTDLNQAEMAPIVEALKAAHEDYRIINGGSGIEVPSDRVLDLRLQLASEGALKDGAIGFEIFDEGGLGVTNFVERLNFQRALQGELARTINRLDQVKAARVHIVLPEESVFLNQDKPASASVVLKLETGAHLDSSQVQGIANLVAAAVEGLKPDQVSIIDTHGRVLASPREDSDSIAPTTLLDYQENLERRLETRIQRFLEKVVGPGKVVAKVQATLGSQAVETVAESFDPDSKVVRSEQRREESKKSSESDARGIPGTSSNLPENSNINDKSGNLSSQKRTEQTINYEIDKTTRKTVVSPGTLERLSVAVLIDGTYSVKEGGDGDAGGTLVYHPRTQAEMQKFQEIIKNAVGYSAERQDEVRVENMQFHQLDADMVPDVKTLDWQTPARYAMVFLGMLLIFLLMRPLFHRIADEGRVTSPELLEHQQAALDAGKKVEELPDGTPRQLLEAGNQERQRHNEMVEIARADIDNTVQTIRDWLHTETA